MHVHIRGYAERAAAKSDAGTPIRFIAATDGLARDGLIIDANAWQLDNYRNNPVFLWAHDYTGARPPIGRVDNLHVDNGKLLADVTFDQSDDFARSIEAKYRNGFLNTVSVGWDTHEAQPTDNPNVAARVTKAELLDISAVPVPGDPNALIERQKRALAQLAKDAERLIDGDDSDESPNESTPTEDAAPSAKPSARATWEDASAAMASLFRPFVQRPESEREAAYKKTARDYARLKKTPPEFLSQSDLDALSAQEIRGLFLEGEPELHADLFAAMETRAGAVLSQRNLDDLKSIVGLAQGIIDRATKQTQNADSPDETPERASDSIAALYAYALKGNQ